MKVCKDATGAFSQVNKNRTMHPHLPCYIRSLVDFLTSDGVYPKIASFHGPTADPVVNIDGKDIIQMSSPNYLGLANHPEVNEAAIRAVSKYGITVCSSRISAGNIDLYDKLEDNIARFMGCEAAIIFADVSSANRQIISQIMDPYLFPLISPSNDRRELGTRAIFFDKANHASLHEAVALSRGIQIKDRTIAEAAGNTKGVDVFAYRHLDMDDLEDQLKRSDHETKLIVTDGYFSADADLAPLDKIADLAGKYRAMVFVDDAHGSLVLGKKGRGTPEVFSAEDRIDFPVHSLSKAGGARFGYYAGNKKMVDYLRLSRGYLFSGATSGALVAAAIAGLKIALKEPWRREQVLKNGRLIRDSLQYMGYEAPGEKHIVTWIIGDEAKAEAVYLSLLEKGVFAPVMRYPAVPLGRALIRFMPMATHTKDHIERVIDACSHAGKKNKLEKIKPIKLQKISVRRAFIKEKHPEAL